MLPSRGFDGKRRLPPQPPEGFAEHGGMCLSHWPCVYFVSHSLCSISLSESNSTLIDILQVSGFSVQNILRVYIVLIHIFLLSKYYVKLLIHLFGRRKKRNYILEWWTYFCVWNIGVLTVNSLKCHVHLNISFSSIPCFSTPRLTPPLQK